MTIEQVNQPGTLIRGEDADPGVFFETAYLVRRMIGLPKYLQHLWRLDHLCQVPFFAVSDIVGRIRPY